MTQEREINAFSKASIAYQCLFTPEEENLPDVSNIPSGMVHAITNLRTYGYQVDGLVKQIRARQRWYIERQVRKESITKVWVEPDANKAEEYGHWQVNIKVGLDEQKQIVDARMKALDDVINAEGVLEIKGTDTIDYKNLFIRKLLDSYLHVSRGKAGFFLGKGKEMAEAELLARNPDNEMQDKVKPRHQ